MPEWAKKRRQHLGDEVVEEKPAEAPPEPHKPADGKPKKKVIVFDIDKGKEGIVQESVMKPVVRTRCVCVCVCVWCRQGSGCERYS
jgi:hypothetical protein